MMTRSDEVRMLTIEEAADLVAVSARTVRRWIEAGELVGHRFGRRWRISRSDLSDFLNRHRDR